MASCRTRDFTKIKSQFSLKSEKLQKYYMHMLHNSSSSSRKNHSRFSFDLQLQENIFIVILGTMIKVIESKQVFICGEYPNKDCIIQLVTETNFCPHYFSYSLANFIAYVMKFTHRTVS